MGCGGSDRHTFQVLGTPGALAYIHRGAFKMNLCGCDCLLCRGFVSVASARRGSITEILRTVLKDNVRVGGRAEHTCRNCGRPYHKGSGRWSYKSSHRDLIGELLHHYILVRNRVRSHSVSADLGDLRVSDRSTGARASTADVD